MAPGDSWLREKGKKVLSKSSGEEGKGHTAVGPLHSHYLCVFPFVYKLAGGENRSVMSDSLQPHGL